MDKNCSTPWIILAQITKCEPKQGLMDSNTGEETGDFSKDVSTKNTYKWRTKEKNATTCHC
jgi:hypothetical protein